MRGRFPLPFLSAVLRYSDIWRQYLQRYEVFAINLFICISFLLMLNVIINTLCLMNNFVVFQNARPIRIVRRRLKVLGVIAMFAVSKVLSRIFKAKKINIYYLNALLCLNPHIYKKLKLYHFIFQTGYSYITDEECDDRWIATYGTLEDAYSACNSNPLCGCIYKGEEKEHQDGNFWITEGFQTNPNHVGYVAWVSC